MTWNPKNKVIYKIFSTQILSQYLAIFTISICLKKKSVHHEIILKNVNGNILDLKPNLVWVQIPPLLFTSFITLFTGHSSPTTCKSRSFIATFLGLL